MHLITERGSRYEALWEQEGQRVMVRVFVVDGSGYFADGIRRLNDRYDHYDASVMREHARQFSDEQFRRSMHFLVYGS